MKEKIKYIRNAASIYGEACRNDNERDMFQELGYGGQYIMVLRD